MDGKSFSKLLNKNVSYYFGNVKLLLLLLAVKYISLKLIHLYQSSGGSKKLLNIECNFEPTCSEYTKQCIQKYGAFKGWRLGLSRIKRCNQPDLVEKMHDEVP
ncbi:membrane protein insertion efficiency factor YidD [Psychromonas sp. SP041]|uniref:membrane protein insertion efficiency factor YidD n=1 Tax=Psychromonas sp. SP041 TaxID=1365007 RepID=UPI00197E3333|nr:membrane protein insertion efficiency factor YidD [Psychromonas sp. SP041]